MAGDWDMSLPASVVCLFVCFISQVSPVRLKTDCVSPGVCVGEDVVCVFRLDPSFPLLPPVCVLWCVP